MKKTMMMRSILTILMQMKMIRIWCTLTSPSSPDALVEIDQKHMQSPSKAIQSSNHEPSTDARKISPRKSLGSPHENENLQDLLWSTIIVEPSYKPKFNVVQTSEKKPHKTLTQANNRRLSSPAVAHNSINVLNITSQAWKILNKGINRVIKWWIEPKILPCCLVSNSHAPNSLFYSALP